MGRREDLRVSFAPDQGILQYGDIVSVRLDAEGIDEKTCQALRRPASWLPDRPVKFVLRWPYVPPVLLRITFIDRSPESSFAFTLERQSPDVYEELVMSIALHAGLQMRAVEGMHCHGVKLADQLDVRNLQNGDTVAVSLLKGSLLRHDAP